MISPRVASKADAPALGRFISASEKSLDDEAGITSTDMAEQLIRGLFDPNDAWIWETGDGEIVGFLGMNPDSLKKTLYTDVYAGPDVVDAGVDFAVDVLARDFAEWKALPGVNTRDTALINSWGRHGFAPVRTYWQMRALMTDRDFPAVPDGFTMTGVDLTSDDEMHRWHRLHLDAFSEHFGFVPRPFDQWRKLVTETVGMDPAGIFIVLDGDDAVGYVECSDELVDDNFGFVNHIGIAKSHRGRGLGEFLLRHACAYTASKGYEQLELTVDTGNETGALRLYEKAGFTARSSWQQLGRP